VTKKVKTAKKKSAGAAKKIAKTTKKKSAVKKKRPNSPVGRPSSSSIPSSAGGPKSREGNIPPSGRGTVSIRMYRGLLGDFFFVKHTVGANAFKMLIDCGVLQCIGSKANKPVTSLGKERIIAGADDFMKACGGELDLVVATHEHYDHLSGFILANDIFKPLKIAKVWMAWTEDRSDKVANGYRNKKNKAFAALSALARSPALAASSDEMKTVTNLLQFYGGLDPMVGDGMGVARQKGGADLAGNASCEAVLEWLRNRAGPGNVAFLKPGEVARWGVADAFRAYVLGPPREDPKKLRQLDPSKGTAREVYLARGEDVETVVGLAAFHGDSAGPARLEDQPFVPLHWCPYGPNGKRLKKVAAKRQPNAQVAAIYAKGDAKYRRIDTDWLGSAENLALKIDGDVNNTSLALGLELTDSRVLLFPGDAQVGNWLSWGDQTYPADDSKNGPRLKIDEILARAVFYKVGHHASHNATLRERGLELMTDPRLCAMIPVVEKTAQEQVTKRSPKGWPMPYGDLYKRLNELTSGRILRGDGDIGAEKSKFRTSIFRLAYGAHFKASDPLWVELALDL
jgi:hypothetical protein